MSSRIQLFKLNIKMKIRCVSMQTIFGEFRWGRVNVPDVYRDGYSSLLFFNSLPLQIENS